jgi:anti-anti-sigma factor
MVIEVKKQKKTDFQLAIKGEMTIYTALEQKQALYKHLLSVKTLQIDLGGVTEIDSAGIQLLMFLKQEAESRQIKLSLIEHSHPVVEAFELLNLSHHFGDPIMISAEWKSS